MVAAATMAVYTPAEAERLVRDFELAARRQRESAGQAVRLRAAERDLLRSAMQVRGLLEKAVHGDKAQLTEMFTGDAALAARLRTTIDETELSEFNRAHKDFAKLVEQVDVLEAILEKLVSAGGLRVWRGPTAHPESVSYVDAPATFAPGAALDLAPTVLGTSRAGLRWKVSPALPAGLTLDALSGNIVGQLMPGEEVPARTYTVTCSNSVGEASTQLTFGVVEPAPALLQYGGLPAECFTGDRVQWTPALEGGSPRTWSCEPRLPDGLKLDEDSGQIYGQALRAMDLQTYKITAANSSGAASAELQFRVLPAPPVSLSYPEVSGNLPLGSVVYLTPEVELRRVAAPAKRSSWSRRFSGTGAFVGTKWGKVRHVLLGQLMQEDVEKKLRFTIEPELPEGLALASWTGVISGKPEKEVPPTTFTVTVSNDGGSAAANLLFGVKLDSPTGLVYPDIPGVLHTGRQVAYEPEVNGIVCQWSVKEPLPKGLSLDEATGTISGTPVEARAEATYTVVATNSKGEATAEIAFVVRRRAPENLAYRDQRPEYPIGCPVDIRPTVEGDVDEFSVEPSLPPGLALDARTGIVAGTPEAPADEKLYTIVARNESGECRADLSFCIQVLPPAQLSYPRVDDEYGVGEVVALEAELVGGGATTWSVEPPLPAGLTLDAASGAIRGAPTEETEEAHYTVAAENASGSTSAVLTFRVVARPPDGLSYPEMGVDRTHSVGDFLVFRPRLSQDFGARFEVDHALPEGLQLDVATGVISGRPTAPCRGEDFLITAKNGVGATRTCVRLDIAALDEHDEAPPTPSRASTPSSAAAAAARAGYPTDAGSASKGAATSAASPKFVAGLGPTAAERKLLAAVDSVMEDLAYAARLEEVARLEDLPPNPSGRGKKTRRWMLWMVHRVHLNDPGLFALDFSGAEMPLPHMEPRVAPKLMMALATNNHLTTLNLADCNLRKPQGSQLAEALRRNKTLEILNIESNYLDAERILVMTLALMENQDIALTTWRFDHQKDCAFFGRIVEEALAVLVTHRQQLTILGFQCQDQHFNKIIRNALAKNADGERRTRKVRAKQEKEQMKKEPKGHPKILAKITLTSQPTQAPWEVFDDGDFSVCLLRRYVANKSVVPSLPQLSTCMKEQGLPVATKRVSKALRDFRTALLNVYVNTQVILVEEETMEPFFGVLQSWCEKNERFSFDLRLRVGGQRVTFEAMSRPSIEVSPQVARWIEPEAKRVADDGVASTFEEFVVEYGEAKAKEKWEQAPAQW